MRIIVQLTCYGKLYSKWLIFPGQVCNVIPDFLKSLLVCFFCVGVLTIFLKYEPQLSSGLRGSETLTFFFFFLMA